MDWNRRYIIAEAEKGKFVPLTTAELSSLGFDVTATSGRYATFTYDVGLATGVYGTVTPTVSTFSSVNLASVTAATTGTAVDISNLLFKTVFIQVSSNTGAVTVDIQVSPDNSVWYDLDSKTYTATNSNDTFSYNDYFPYMRTATSTHSNATVKTTITGSVN